MPLANALTRLLDHACTHNRFSGVVALYQEAEPRFAYACGYASRPWRIANTVDTRFRLASVSKLFTAVAVLQLVDGGELALDARVLDLLDLHQTTVPPAATVHHLLTMTSGMADWFDELGDWEADWAELCRTHPLYLFRSNADYLPLFVDAPPLAPVGERHRYNGAGFILLGLIIEKLTGQSYFDWIEHAVFAPAGMVDSSFLALDGVDGNVADGYVPVKEGEQTVGWRRNIYSTTPEGAADGGATSTAADLARFSLALRRGDLLSPHSTATMLTPKVPDGEEPYRGYLWKYGYGNMFIEDGAGRIVRWGHTGEEDGVSCRFYHYPAYALDVIILGNQSWCAGELAWEIHDLLVAEEFALSS